MKKFPHVSKVVTFSQKELREVVSQASRYFILWGIIMAMAFICLAAISVILLHGFSYSVFLQVRAVFLFIVMVMSLDSLITILFIFMPKEKYILSESSSKTEQPEQPDSVSSADENQLSCNAGVTDSIDHGQPMDTTAIVEQHAKTD